MAGTGAGVGGLVSGAIGFSQANDVNAALADRARAANRDLAFQSGQVERNRALAIADNRRAAARRRGEIGAALTSAGISGGTTRDLLLMEVDTDEGRNADLINTNALNQRTAMRSQARAMNDQLGAASQDPILSAFLGALAGAANGLGIGMNIDAAFGQPEQPTGGQL